MSCAEAVSEAHKTEAHSWDTAQEERIVPKLKGAVVHVSKISAGKRQSFCKSDLAVYEKARGPRLAWQPALLCHRKARTTMNKLLG